MSKFWYTE